MWQVEHGDELGEDLVVLRAKVASQAAVQTHKQGDGVYEGQELEDHLVNFEWKMTN